MPDTELDTDTDTDTLYAIVRFHRDGPSEIVQTGLTLAEAKAHCRRDDTHGDDWFDGFTESDRTDYP